MKKTAAAVLVAQSNAEVFFKETFDTADAWVQSEWKKEQMGNFELSSGKLFADEKEDQSYATKQDARFYGASATFPAFSNKGKDLIVQYQVKYEQDVECGGGYLKMGPKMDDAKEFGDPTKYYIMFGPDKCGHQKRTHLIFTNPAGKNILKTKDLPYQQSDNHAPSLYRLTVSDGKTVTVEIDGASVYTGTLKEDWDMVGVPKEIEDPADKKPEDWVDEDEIDDPEDTKPEDWVDGPEKIADPQATKPDDWDAEEDGEWEAPMISNPAFKGEWSPKRIANPAFKGFWAPKRIPNPEYSEDETAGSYEDIAFVGFDLWQVKSGTMFDNVIITDDVTEADKLKENWSRLKEVKPPAPATPDLDDDNEDLDDDEEKELTGLTDEEDL